MKLLGENSSGKKTSGKMKGNLFGRFHVVHHYTNKTFLLFYPDGPLTLTMRSRLHSTILTPDLSNPSRRKKGQTQRDCSPDGNPLFPRPALAADGTGDDHDVISCVISGGLAGVPQRQLRIPNNTCLVLMEVSSGTGLISQRLHSGLRWRHNCCKHNGP